MVVRSLSFSSSDCVGLDLSLDSFCFNFFICKAREWIRPTPSFSVHPSSTSLLPQNWTTDSSPSSHHSSKTLAGGSASVTHPPWASLKTFHPCCCGIRSLAALPTMQLADYPRASWTPLSAKEKADVREKWSKAENTKRRQTSPPLGSPIITLSLCSLTSAQIERCKYSLSLCSSYLTAVK